ncbi:MAG: hypothetical protein HY315_10720 [Acidobacteria bacterium]|nr:hypothetical protein [Acidobacteriota bacterium]
MRKRTSWTILLLSGLTLALIYFLVYRSEQGKKIEAYEAPRVPVSGGAGGRLPDAELKVLAKAAVRGTEGDTALGKVRPGQKVLLEISDGQDMKLLAEIIAAYKERGVHADYVYDSRMVEQMLGIPKAEALDRGILRVAGEGGGSGPRDGYIESLWFPTLLPQNLKKEAEELQKKGDSSIGGRDITGMQGVGAMYRSAIRKYLDLHPEYHAFFGGRPNRIYMISELGQKWFGYFAYRSPSNMGGLLESKYPSDVWRLIIERTIEVIPWIEKVRVTDPEGTDYGFSMTAEQAELWSRGANIMGAVYMSPYQASRELYALERWRGQVVPDVEGVVAGTVNHSGYYPQIKLYLKKGMVDRLEGGGRFGELWRILMAQERIQKLHYPLHPYPGFFYFCEAVMQTHPKAANPEAIHYGFGVGNLSPEVEAYAKKNNVPNWHGFHVHQYFTTYEVKTRTSEKRFKIMDKGHLTAWDDPEVRALARKYGKVDEILRKAVVRAIPGINVPGVYEKDYGNAPLPYVRREAQEIKDGTYPYLYTPEWAGVRFVLQ